MLLIFCTNPYLFPCINNGNIKKLLAMLPICTLNIIHWKNHPGHSRKLFFLALLMRLLLLSKFVLKESYNVILYVFKMFFICFRWVNNLYKCIYSWLQAYKENNPTQVQLSEWRSNKRIGLCRLSIELSPDIRMPEHLWQRPQANTPVKRLEDSRSVPIRVCQEHGGVRSTSQKVFTWL